MYDNQMASKDQRRGHQAIESRDLNKTCPNDDFPFPHIDVLVNSTTGSALLSFMYGFLRYNQIKMAFKEMMKSTFTIE